MIYPENKRNKIFGFRPGAGIHDIHRNQGNDARHRSDDGVWQMEALFFIFQANNGWEFGNFSHLSVAVLAY